MGSPRWNRRGNVENATDAASEGDAREREGKRDGPPEKSETEARKMRGWWRCLICESGSTAYAADDIVVPTMRPIVREVIRVPVCEEGRVTAQGVVTRRKWEEPSRATRPSTDRGV